MSPTKLCPQYYILPASVCDMYLVGVGTTAQPVSNRSVQTEVTHSGQFWTESESEPEPNRYHPYYLELNSSNLNGTKKSQSQMEVLMFTCMDHD
jgi:hypothetical protein